MHGGDIYSSKVKMDFSVNVNPLGVNRKILKTVKKTSKKIACYPQIESRDLCAEIAEKYGLKKENVVFGNGASELINAICKTASAAAGQNQVYKTASAAAGQNQTSECAATSASALIFAPCFTEYEAALLKSGFCVTKVKLEKENDFAFTDKTFLDFQNSFKKSKPALVFITNPNNPNGKLIPVSFIKKIAEFCKTEKSFLVVDECFIDFVEFPEQSSYLKLVTEEENLIILRAFTKSFAIPSLRAGWCLTSSSKIAESLRLQLPLWNASLFAQECSKTALKLDSYLLKTRKFVKKERNFLCKKMADMGVKVFPSDANFLLFYSSDFELKEKFLEKKILIRDCSDYAGLEKGFYRIAVKKRKENRIFLKKLSKILKEKGE